MVRFLTRFGIVALVTSLGFGLQGMAQQEVPIEHATPQQLAGIAKDNSRHFGDDPDDAAQWRRTYLRHSIHLLWVQQCARLRTGSWSDHNRTLTAYGPGVCSTAVLWQPRIR